MASAAISVSIAIKAPAEAIFAVLIDPAKHAAIDGTGWVRDPLDRQLLTALGQIFRMAMYHANHPNGNYEMANRVQVFDPPHAISWEPGYDPGDGNLLFGGWIWRYDLAPLGPVRDRGQALLRLVGGTRGGAPAGPVSTFLPRSPGQFVDPPRRTGGCLSARPPIWGMSNDAAMASLSSLCSPSMPCSFPSAPAGSSPKRPRVDPPAIRRPVSPCAAPTRPLRVRRRRLAPMLSRQHLLVGRRRGARLSATITTARPRAYLCYVTGCS